MVKMVHIHKLLKHLHSDVGYPFHSGLSFRDPVGTHVTDSREGHTNIMNKEQVNLQLLVIRM